MKRVLSLVLVLVLVLGAIMPVFAEETASQAALDLETYGVIVGNGNDLGETLPLTRAQMAVLYAKLQGKATEAEAHALPTTLLDAGDDWYTPWVAYANEQEWMVGSDNMFRPLDNVTAQEVRVLLLKALGQFTAWENVTADAEANGIVLTAADETLPLGSEVFASVRSILDMTPAEGTETLGTVLALTDYVAPVVEEEVVALEVVSVTATDHKEIEVVFNNELDADTVVAANFVVTGGAATTPSLGADKMTVTVVLADADALATQPLAVTLTIKNVEDVNEDKLASEEHTLSILDTAKPEVVSIELTGPQTFDITFSEPIKTAPALKVNNGIYGVTVNALDGSNVVTGTLSATQLNDGDYTVEVKSFADYAGIVGDTTEMTLVYAADATTPTAEIKSATQTSVVVKFDRAVTLDAGTEEDYFYHTFNTYQPATATPNAAKTEWTLDFTAKPIPAGAFTLVINQDGSADVDIVDEWGNKVTEDIVLTGEVTADTTAPTITGIKVVSEAVVEITFSEDMENGANEMLKEANFVVKDSDGDAVTAFTATYDAADPFVSTLTFAPQLAGGNYTVEVSGITDKALAANTLVAVTNPFVITDLTAITPADTSVEYVLGTTDDDSEIIYVTYPEAMATTGQYSVLDAGNYLLDTNNDTTFAALHADATLEMFGTTGKVVKITIPHDAELDNASVIQIARVADAAGNEITELSFNETMTVAGAPVVTDVDQTATNKITITINKPLQVVLASGFTTGTAGAVDNDTLAAIDSWSVNSDNETVILATLNADDVASATDTSDVLAELDVVANILVAETGIKMAATDVTGLIDDARAPELEATTPIVQAGNVFTLTFTENVSTNSDALAATDFVITDPSGDVLVAGDDYTVAISEPSADVVITISATLEDGDYTFATVASPNYIFDNAVSADTVFDTGENKMAALDSDLAVDGVFPTVSAVVLTDADDDGVIETATVTFSEAVLDASVTAYLGGNGTQTIGGQAITGGNTGATADDATYVFTTADGGAIGTGVVDLLFAIGADTLSITDAKANKMAAVVAGDVVETETAGPVLLSWALGTNDFDAVNDTIVLTFSENVVLGDELAATGVSLAVMSDFLGIDLAGGTTADTLTSAGTPTFGFAVSTTDLTITLEAAALTSGGVTSATTDINILDFSNIVDASGNVSVDPGAWVTAD